MRKETEQGVPDFTSHPFAIYYRGGAEHECDGDYEDICCDDNKTDDSVNDRVVHCLRIHCYSEGHYLSRSL